MVDKLKFLLAALAVIAGIAGFYLLGADAALLRTGAVLGGLLLGAMETFGAGFVSSAYKDAFAFLILLLVLFIRPTGLFGKEEVKRV